MRQPLSFLKESKYSYGFRTIRGHDDEILLSEEDVESLPKTSGVYVIVAADKTKFIYPRGKSPVIYIGKADNLHRRLREHLRRLRDLEEYDEEWLYAHKETQSRYQYLKSFGGRVFTFHTLGKQDAKDLEALILWRFYEKYRSLPVGNGARSFSGE